MASDYESLLDKSTAKHFVLKDSKMKDFGDSPIFSTVGQGELMVHLRQTKEQLNETKGYISRLIRKHGITKWRAHTAFTHPMKQLPKILAGDLPPNSICTQAYCKFAEILLAYPQLLNPVVYIDSKDNSRSSSSTSSKDAQWSSFHLCESPGGFVSCLENTVDKNRNWDWRMNSLNPHHEYNNPSEMLCDDTLIVEYPHKMVFGQDDTGNILNWTDGFVKNLRRKWNFRLVTADGSQNCTDNPIAQEVTVAPLIAQEVNIALGCLQTGGNLVLKMFTFFEFVTHNILAQLLANFECVEVCKPASSKPGNSEVYVVCLNFESNCSSSPFPPLSNNQLQRIADCATYFASHQMKWISFNLKTFNNLSANERQNMDIRKCLQIETLKSRIVCKTAGSSNNEAIHQNENNPWLKHWNSSKYKSGQIWPSDNCFQTFTSEQKAQPTSSTAMVNMCREAENLHATLMNINGLTKPPLFVVQRVAHNNELQQSVIHSLFCSVSLLKHNYERVVDLCQVKEMPNTPSVGTFKSLDCWQMTKIDWMDLLTLVYSQEQPPNCSYNAKKPRFDRIEQKRQSVVLNIQPNTLILSRFAASVTFLLMLKFERIYLRGTKIAFDGERYISDSQRSCISTLVEYIKSTDEHEVLQFVPLKSFANPDFYYMLMTYNNTKLNNLKINDMP